MRWFTRSLAALALAWAVFYVSPYWALYDLARAVQSRDLARIDERVNFHAVRISIAKQLVTAYLTATGRASDIKGPSGDFAVGLGATIADPLVAEYITPERLADVLQGSTPAAGGAVPSVATAADLGTHSLASAWKLFAGAETRGFRAVSFAVPVDKPRDAQFRLQMRLSGATWRLVGLGLPSAVEQRLVQELIRRNAQAS